MYFIRPVHKNVWVLFFNNKLLECVILLHNKFVYLLTDNFDYSNRIFKILG